MAAEFEVQKAIYSVLSAQGLRVYDAAPQAADSGAASEFPYSEVGDIVMSEYDTQSVAGFDFAARIHTRSRSSSMKEAKQIQGSIYAALHRGGLTIPGYRCVLLLRETSFVTRASDGSFHGVCEYRGLIETA